MKFKFYLFLACVFYSELTLGAHATKDNKAIIVKSYSQAVCNAELVFENEVAKKSQIIKPKDGVSLDLTQYLSSKVYKGSTIVNNVICQKLSGSLYTGSDEEWANFIRNAANGLKSAKAKSIKLFLTGNAAKIYPSTKDNKEYDFKANFNGNNQVIKNIAILDKPRNTVYTISVSGAQRSEDEVVKEFTRLVNSFKLN